MTKKEAILTKRLAAAHRFIRGQMNHAKNYGSTFSSSLYVECEAFLEDSEPPRESSFVVIPKWRYERLTKARLAQLKANQPQ